MKKMELQNCVLGTVSTNCYFLKNKETGEVVIIDPADRIDRIKEKVLEMNAKPVAVLLTHGHYDHILAADDVKREFDVKIYACQEEAGLLMDPSWNLSAYTGKSCSIKADVQLKDLDVFEAAGFSIQMLHTPGHTQGSCCYYLKDEGVLFSGDTVFYGSVGRTDFPGGSTAQIVRSLHKLVDNLPEETEVFPGHDISTTIGYEKRYNPFV